LFKLTAQIVGAADMLTLVGMAFLGFRFRRQARSTFFTTFPFRPQTLLAPASPAPELSYFYRPHRSTTSRPIVLIHGIGIGYAPYLPLLRLIPRDVGIIAIEILPVSCRITAPLPPTDVVANAIATIVAHHQAVDAFPHDLVLTVHSFGSLYAAALLHNPRMSPSVHSLVLMDPVSLLLHLPDVAYNFTRRPPKFANELQIWLAVASDSNVAHTLARRICWREMRLTREDLLPDGMAAADGAHRALRRTTALFGGRDNVTNPDAVASYVYSGRARHAEIDRDEWRVSPARWTGHGELELMYLDGLDHGQAFLSPRYLPLLAKVLNTYAEREGPEPKMAEIA
jgi:pimeloyl-ACP methyl ester carboxylesterase